MDKNILLVDKPSGITSHDVVDRVRRLTGEKRVGHAGTLDPLASGLLIILIGRDATKRQSEFLHLDKVYECTAELGRETDTYDSDGKELKRTSVPAICIDDLGKVLATFVGKIQQRVPAYSAVKVKGQKLYNQARKGEIDEAILPVKEVEVFSLKLHSFDGKVFSFTVHCSSGTYIRSLVHDIGQKLGVGAIVTQLRRTRIGEFSVSDAKQV